MKTLTLIGAKIFSSGDSVPVIVEHDAAVDLWNLYNGEYDPRMPRPVVPEWITLKDQVTLHLPLVTKIVWLSK